MALLQARPIFLPAVEGPYPARAKPQFRIVVGGAEWGMYGVPIRPAPFAKEKLTMNPTAAILALLVCAVASADGFIQRNGSQLTLDGEPYRAIGVNMPHLSQSYLGTWFHWQQIYGTREAMKQSIIDALDDAAARKVAFIRFFASPGYPKDTAELYLADPDEYWRRMDEVFALCRERNIKLIPSLGVLKWSSDCRELKPAVLDPDSKTHAATYKYVREFVTRYKDDPTVLMWELENEAFLIADVDMQGRKALPAGCYPTGTEGLAEEHVREDSFTFDMLIQLYREATAFIKEIDPNHLVTSGDSGPREESMSRRLTFPDFKYRNDTLREHISNLLDSQPAPLDVMSVHMYGNFDGARKVENLSNLDFLRARIKGMHAARTPVFIGELGQAQPHFTEDPEAKWTRAALDLADEEGVALSAIWVWHFPWQDKDFNIPSGDAHPELMQQIADFNEAHAGL